MKYCTVCDSNVLVYFDLDGIQEIDCDEEGCPFNRECIEKSYEEYAKNNSGQDDEYFTDTDYKE